MFYAEQVARKRTISGVRSLRFRQRSIEIIDYLPPIQYRQQSLPCPHSPITADLREACWEENFISASGLTNQSRDLPINIRAIWETYIAFVTQG